jgi:hypothetical protein
MLVAISYDSKTAYLDILDTDDWVVESIPSREIKYLPVSVFQPRYIGSDSKKIHYDFNSIDSKFVQVAYKWKQSDTTDLNMQYLLKKLGKNKCKFINSELGRVLVTNYKNTVIITDFESAIYQCNVSTLSPSQIKKQLLDSRYNPELDAIVLKNADVIKCDNVNCKYQINNGLTTREFIVNRNVKNIMFDSSKVKIFTKKFTFTIDNPKLFMKLIKRIDFYYLDALELTKDNYLALLDYNFKYFTKGKLTIVGDKLTDFDIMQYYDVDHLIETLSNCDSDSICLRVDEYLTYLRLNYLETYKFIHSDFMSRNKINWIPLNNYVNSISFVLDAKYKANINFAAKNVLVNPNRLDEVFAKIRHSVSDAIPVKTKYLFSNFFDKYASSNLNLSVRVDLDTDLSIGKSFVYTFSGLDYRGVENVSDSRGYIISRSIEEDLDKIAKYIEILNANKDILKKFTVICRTDTVDVIRIDIIVKTDSTKKKLAELFSPYENITVKKI